MEGPKLKERPAMSYSLSILIKRSVPLSALSRGFFSYW